MSPVSPPNTTTSRQYFISIRLLMHEMQFYFIVFLVCLFGAQRWRDNILVLIGGAILIALMLMPNPPYEWLSIEQSLVLYSFFTGGALVAIIYRAGYSFHWLALLLGLCAFAATKHWQPLVVYSLYAAMLFLTIRRVATLPIPFSYTLGA